MIQIKYLGIKKEQSVANIRGVCYLNEKKRANKLVIIIDANGVGKAASLQAATTVLEIAQLEYVLVQ